MTKTEQIQDALNLKVDDRWGPQTDAAVAAEKAASIARHSKPAPASFSQPSLHWPLEADAESFYGASDGSSRWESEHLTTLEPPYAMFMDGQLIRRIRCHKLVVDSLDRILLAIRDRYQTPAMLRAVGLDQYDGCYNYRNVRGATHLSMHAYGAAIDFDAADNPLGATHGKMPAEVVAMFKAEGWRWGGDYTGRKDWMHFEACR